MEYGDMTDKFNCVECRHHLRVRSDDHKVICALTLEMKDKDNPASCEYAERQVANPIGNAQSC